MNGKTFFAFVTGAVFGAAGAWLYFNKKYFGPVEEIEEDDELVSTDNTVSNKSDSSNETEEATESERMEYQKIAKQYTEEPKEEVKKPYVITADDYGDGTVMYAITYSYFEDGVVTDEEDQIVEDADEAIGEDFVNHFGDEDVCYIRNEQRRCDYEILREGCTYNEPPEED